MRKSGRALSFREALDSCSGYKTVSIVTGPKGGFESYEAGQAGNSGLLVATMRPRILRCGTAPLCALSAVMFHAGELNRWGKN